ncbi:hypothetical protein F5X97DRAFT_328231 [Nemania serpens]|nr:hypothetical protein F5X97DRAFT_328231 [Nemania serpens]
MHVSLPTTHLLQCVSRPTSRGKRAKRFEASRVKRGIGDVDGRGGDGGAARPVSTGAAEASISWSRSSTFDRPMPDTTWHQTTTTPSCVASDTRPQEGTALCSRPFLFAADAMDLWIPTVAEMIIAEKIGAKWHVPTTWAVIEITDAQLLLLGCRTCGWARVFRCPRNESIDAHARNGHIWDGRTLCYGRPREATIPRYGREMGTKMTREFSRHDQTQAKANHEQRRDKCTGRESLSSRVRGSPLRAGSAVPIKGVSYELYRFRPRALVTADAWGLDMSFRELRGISAGG